MPAPKEILDLVERFGEHLDAYRNGVYKEAQLRQEFLDPFFRALGWDMDNTQGFAEAYKEVIHEDTVKIGANTKAPDYSFRVGGTRKYFVEAKKPSVYVKGEPAPAFQLRRYAWSAKLPLSILTDFEEFAVYDCRIKPSKNDPAATARIHYWTFRDYADKWDEIAAIFSKDALHKGSFDKFAATVKGKRGTAEVDSAFLDEIETWRETLAKNIALRNPDLSQPALNYAVQQSIDRIVFLRICEDRGIEPYGQLQALQNGTNTYKRLSELFRKADERYNSGLFHFQKEDDRAEEPDRLTLKLDIDDKPLKEIFQNFYYPDSPYEFSVIGADILGSVYERFLGKVIRLTAGHHAKVEERPEVKKAGGVYYTPTYIVDYIVKHTVGKLLVGKTPKEVEKLRILDPACGSGSFLIGAYQYLLDWHRDWYEQDGAEKHAKGKQPKLYQGKGGMYRLTTSERKRILTHNIHGVDIDSQAVEVTKLSLLLKVLEGESDRTLQTQLFHERVLPDLGRNIKCGNSLIGPDFYEQQSLSLDDIERARINVFDWEKEFPGIFKPSPSGRRDGGLVDVQWTSTPSSGCAGFSRTPAGTNVGEGGFDVVIGNPPYIRIQVMKEWAPQEVEYYKERYVSASKGNYDIYVVFVEKGLSLLNKTGRLGFILPHKFFNAQYGEPLRGLISQGKHLAEVMHFGDQQVFDSATTYTCLLFLSKSAVNKCGFHSVKDIEAWRNNGFSEQIEVASTQITGREWNFVTGAGSGLVNRLAEIPNKLGSYAHLFVGLQTDADDVYIVEEIRQEKNRVLCASKATEKEHWLEDSHLKPFLKGSLNIRRYRLSDATKRLIFPYETIAGRSELIPATDYKKRYPLTWNYLEENKERLTARNKGKMGDAWYGYVYKKNHTRFGSPKLLVPSIATGSCFAADLAGKYYFVGSGGGGGGGYGIILEGGDQKSYLCLLGILNSRVLSYYLVSTSTPFRGGYIALNRQYIEQLPIRLPEKPASRDAMAMLVEQILSLHTKMEASGTPHEQQSLKRQIDATDRQIDKLVYELYGLTEYEIEIIDKGASSN